MIATVKERLSDGNDALLRRRKKGQLGNLHSLVSFSMYLKKMAIACCCHRGDTAALPWGRSHGDVVELLGP